MYFSALVFLFGVRGSTDRLTNISPNEMKDAPNGFEGDD